MSASVAQATHETGEDYARARDAADELAPLRERFWLPRGRGADPPLYLCGHSLGLQPKSARQAVADELEQWRTLAVDGHFAGDRPWISSHERLRAPLAALVGAAPDEVVAMNTLTVNLHLMLVSFYRPDRTRYRIVIEKHAFPSDRYAVASQLRFHGHDPADALVELEDEPGSARLSPATLGDYLNRHGETVALVLLPGLQYVSGEWQDVAELTRVAHRHGCRIGFDLAHGAGNLPLALNDWDCDFALWCGYKYLNGGPGTVAGCFVNRRHFGSCPRLEGWWGNDPGTRFRMAHDFQPAPGADAWQLSNPPILALAPLEASLAIFAEVGIQRLRAKSIALTGYLAFLLERLRPEVTLLTPGAPERRGCQLSLRVAGGAERGRAVFEALLTADAIGDWRAPDVIRAAPVPLYNRFLDVYRFVERLRAILKRVR